MSRKAEKNQAIADGINAEAKVSSPVCFSMPGNVIQMEDCKKVVAEAVKRFGQIDILVNGAAGNFMATADKLSSGGIRRVIEIDTLGTFHMSQQVFNQSMKERRSGTIINISTTLHWNGHWGLLHACAAKAGVDAITKCLAVEWGPYGVRVNAFIPGMIAGTEGFERLNPSNTNDKDKTNSSVEAKSSETGANKEGYNQARKLIPLQRFGHVNDVSNACLFLASPAASFMTGSFLLADGGQYLTSPNTVMNNP